MDKEDALEIISMIIDGLNPYGEIDAAKEPPEDNPVTIRAICTAIASLLTEADKEKLASNYRVKKLSSLIDCVNGPLKLRLIEKEKHLISQVLREVDYNEEKAAEKLEITLKELTEKIWHYDLDPSFWVKNPLRACIEKYLTLDQLLEKIEKELILEVLKKVDFNKTNAAELLGITFRSMRHRIEKYKIENTYDAPEINYLSCFNFQSLNDFLEDIEKRAINEALEETNFNKIQTADLLRITFRSLRHRLGRYGLS